MGAVDDAGCRLGLFNHGNLGTIETTDIAASKRADRGSGAGLWSIRHAHYRDTSRMGAFADVFAADVAGSASVEAG